MDIPYGTLRLSPRQQPTVSASDARPGSAAEHGVRPTLDTQPSDKPQMLRQALPASDAHQAALSAGQPAWLAATGATSLQQSALHKASDVHASDAARLDAAVALHIAARAQQDEGRAEEAHKGYLEALSLYQSALGTEHAYIAIGHTDLGWLLSAQGKHEAALASFRTALAIEEKAPEPY
jgi:tetratricopeptide (TPR) repeat protein